MQSTATTVARGSRWLPARSCALPGR